MGIKKKSLQDIKLENKRLLLGALAQGGSLSRIELSQLTGLSPSTVTTLVAELLGEGLLCETGVSESTGGRKRVLLTLNPRAASILVVEVRRGGCRLHGFDMCLEPLFTRPAATAGLTGNELFCSLTAAIDGALCEVGGGKEGAAAGIGLLFEEEVDESETSVMYSTSLSSATISLAAALTTRYRLPVLEEYSLECSLLEVMGRAPYKAQGNAAYVHLGRRVLAAVCLQGKAVQLGGRAVFDLSPLLAEKARAPWLPAPGEEAARLSQGAGLPAPRPPAGERSAAAVKQLCQLLKTLLVFFPVDTVFLSAAGLAPGLLQAVREALQAELPPQKAPALRPLEAGERQDCATLAGRVRARFLRLA